MISSINGVSVEGYKAFRRPRKADQGHSIVETTAKADAYRFRIRRSILCQCGKRMSGWDNRAFYSYDKHLRDELS